MCLFSAEGSGAVSLLLENKIPFGSSSAPAVGRALCCQLKLSLGLGSLVWESLGRGFLSILSEEKGKKIKGRCCRSHLAL